MNCIKILETQFKIKHGFVKLIDSDLDYAKTENNKYS